MNLYFTYQFIDSVTALDQRLVTGTQVAGNLSSSLLGAAVATYGSLWWAWPRVFRSLCRPSLKQFLRSEKQSVARRACVQILLGHFISEYLTNSGDAWFWAFVL